MTTATEIKNSPNSEVNRTEGSNNSSNTNDDVVTIRIPQKITLELPRSFSFDIPKWVGPVLIGTGALAFLSIVTGGAIWRFWWLIFCMPWFWNGALWGGYSCGTKKQRKSSHGYPSSAWSPGQGSGKSSKRSSKHQEPTPTSEMYV